MATWKEGLTNVVTLGGALSSSAEKQGASLAAIEQEKMEKAEEMMDLARKEAAPTESELGAVRRLIDTRDRSLKLQEDALSRQYGLLDAVDPAIREAGEQAYKMMRGQEAKTLDPIRNERTRTRRNLESKLRERLGTGWETSSAGIEAMSRFDEQTGSLLSRAQQTAISSYLGVSLAARPDPSKMAATFAQTMGGLDTSLLQAEQAQASRRVGAITGTFKDVIKTSGAQHAGAYYENLAKAQTMGAMMQMGGTMAGAAMGSPSSGRAAGDEAARSQTVTPRQ